MPGPSPIHRRRLIAVAVLLIFFGGLAAAGFVYRRKQIEERFHQWRADGFAAVAAGDDGKTVDYLGRYLSRYPDDVPALVAYAAAELRTPHPDEARTGLAIQALRYALHLDPTLARQRRTLMGLYLRNGYLTKAIEEADALLAAEAKAAAASDREVLAARATALARLRRTGPATAAADAWCAADPSSVEARLLRLDLAHVVGQPSFEADAMVRRWSDAGGLTAAAGDLLRGHARVLDADPTAARVPLTAAAHDQPFDPSSAGPLVRDLDVVGLPALALDVARGRHLADPTDLPVRIDLVRREWTARQFGAVVSLVAGVTDRSQLPAETVGLDAVARSELGRAAELKPISAELSARGDLVSRAWAVLTDQLGTGRFDPDKLLAACGPALQETDGPILRYYLGVGYLALGDRLRAGREWQRVVAADPAWVLPAIKLCQLLTEDGRPRAALAAGIEAARRAPSDSEAAVALAAAWAAAIDVGQDHDAPGCLQLIGQLTAQLPNDTHLPALAAAVLAHESQPADASAVIQAALKSDRVLPEQTWFDFAATSATAGLGLERQCLDRDRAEHGVTPRSAYARAVSLFYQSPSDPAEGLASFDADRAAAKLPPTDPADFAWALARARYLDVTASPGAAAAWSALGESLPRDVGVQRMVVSASAVQGDGAVMSRAVDRLRDLVGVDSAAYQIARARYDVTFGTTPADGAEARRYLDDLLRQSPESFEAHLLSARAFERSSRPSGAIADLQAAASVDPDSATVRLSLARLLQSQGDFDGALNQLDHLDLKRLTSDDQRQQAATLLSAHGEADRAIDVLRRPAGSQTVGGQVMLARLYQRDGHPDQAVAVLNELLKTHPDPAVIAFGADLLASSGDVGGGRNLLARLDASAVATLVRAEFALRYESAADAGPALSLFADATAAAPGNAVAWRARVGANLITGHARDAVAVAGQGCKSVPEDAVLKFFRDAGPAVEATAADPAARPLLLAAVADPAALVPVAEVMQAIHAAQDPSRTIDWLANRVAEIAAKYPAFPPADLYLISVYDRAGRPDDAVAVAARAGQSFPDDAAVLRAETDALARARQWSQVIAVAEKWKRQVPADAADADLAAAAAMTESGRPLDVAALLRPYTQLASAPGHVAAVAAVARARVVAGDTEPAADMQPLLSMGPSGRAAWMSFAVQSLPSDQAAVDIRRAIGKMPPGDAAEHVTASEMWAKLADQTGDPAFAAAAVDTLAPFVADPDAPLPVLLAAASWDEKTGDVSGAETLYYRVLKASPNQPTAANNLAMILARSGRAGQASRLMDEVIRVFPQWPDLYDTRAFVNLEAGHPDTAGPDIDHALRLEPRRVGFRLRRVMILAAAGKARDAETAARQIESDYPDKASIPAEVQKQLSAARAQIADPK